MLSWESGSCESSNIRLLKEGTCVHRQKVFPISSSGYASITFVMA